MSRVEQAKITPANTNLHEQVMPDRRLSRLEVSFFATALLCLFLFGAVFLNKQLVQNQTDQMTNRVQSVSDWIRAAHDVRKRNAGLAPERCRRIRNPLSTCFQDMVASGQPFEGLKNIYASEQKTSPAFAFIAVPRSDSVIASCLDLPSPVFLSAPKRSGEGRPENWTGVIIVQPATLMNNLSEVVNSLSVGYCDRQQRLVWVGNSVSF